MQKIDNLPFVPIRVKDLEISLYQMTTWCSTTLDCRPMLYTDPAGVVFLFKDFAHAILFKLRFGQI